MLLIEQLERRVLADRQGLIARGDGGDDLPTFGLEQATFDDWLAAEPESREAMTPADLEKLEELIALGVA